MARKALAGGSVSRRLCVVLVATRNPLNIIGAAARAMSNFGFGTLRVVNPYELAFRQARSAVGASALLKNAKEYKSVAEAVADCSLVVGTTAASKRKLDHELRPLHEGALLIRKDESGSVALLFGSEKRGLSNEDLSYCHWLMRIPTVREHPSMNLGQAVAVCLHELVREANGPLQAEKQPAATAAELDRLTAMLLDALHASGYVKPAIAGPTEERIRRLVCRLSLSAEDAQVWLGILRQILWKMRLRD